MDTKARVRLALAIACLRIKPQNVSGREYAQRLCDQYIADTVQLKRKLGQAETKILHLKQQLMMKESGVEIQVDENVQEQSQPLFPTPPPSGRANHAATLPDVSLAKNITFLQHVTNLQTVSSTMRPELDRLTVDSVLHSLDVLPSFLGQDSYSCKLQNECVRCIVKIFEQLEAKHLHGIVQKILRLCQEIVNCMVNEKLNQQEIQDARQQLIIDLGSGCNLGRQVMDILCVEVNQSFEHLHFFSSQRHNLDAACYVNLFYILNALDSLTGKCCQTLEQHEKYRIKSQLEDAMLHINEYMPVISHFLMKTYEKLK